MTINSNFIKNASLIALSIILIYSIVSIGNYKTILQNNKVIMDYLEESNNNIKQKFDSLQNIYNLKEKTYTKLDSIIDNREKQLFKLKLENKQLQSKLTNLENEMANVTPDSSYNYLMHRYVPKQDSLKYKFAPNQVKSIHYDVLAFDYTKAINNKLDSIVNNLTILYNTSSRKFQACNDQKVILLKQKDLLNDKVVSLENLNNNYIKQIKKEKFKSTAFGIGAVGIITYIVVKSVTNK